MLWTLEVSDRLTCFTSPTDPSDNLHADLPTDLRGHVTVPLPMTTTHWCLTSYARGAFTVPNLLKLGGMILSSRALGCSRQIAADMHAYVKPRWT